MSEFIHDDFPTRVLPSLRVDNDATFDSSLIIERLDFFQQMGCRLADHAVNEFDSELLHFLGGQYGRRGWIMQLHIGAQRQTSTRLRQLAGPAGGYATIGPSCDIPGLCRLLDDLEQAGCLPRTILYPLNPADYAALATLTGSFAEDGVRGKIQLGPAWWYNDHAWGIRQHLDALASYGLLSTFIGMTTDSRSLLSMSRHEYFRRVLCDWLGDQVQAGILPDDDQLLGPLVRAVCFDNARRWLDLEGVGIGAQSGAVRRQVNRPCLSRRVEHPVVALIRLVRLAPAPGRSQVLAVSLELNNSIVRKRKTLLEVNQLEPRTRLS